MEADEYSVNSRYWSAISRDMDEFICPSPVNIPAWASATAQWLGEGTSVLEVGPGRGDLAVRSLTETSTIQEYILADISKNILQYAAKRLERVKGTTTITRIHADLNAKNALRTIPPASVDRVILLNVFGYLDPQSALEQFSTVLRPGGLLRFTLGDYEFFSQSGNYDPGLNRQLVTKRRKQVGTRVQPAGFTVTETGEQIPVFGFRRGYSREEITGILAGHGFVDIDIRTVVIPIEFWLRLRPRISVSRKQQAIADKCGGRPVWDIIARRGE
jgi:ubiquinone/menaquinone biosynthesis C-methylase UbiE